MSCTRFPLDITKVLHRIAASLSLTRVASASPAALLTVSLTLLMTSPAFGEEHIRCAPVTMASQCLQSWLASGQQVDMADVRVVAMTEDTADVRTLQLARSTPAARMQALVMRENGETRTLWFQVSLYRDMAVWTRDADAGESVRVAKPVLRRIDVTNLPDYLTSLAETRHPDINSPADPAQPTAGTEFDSTTATLRRAVRAGMPVRRSDVKTADDISAGDAVRFVVNDNRIAINGLGRALENGKAGEALRVLPTHTGQPITAVVLGKQ